MASQAFSSLPQRKKTWHETSDSGPCAWADLMIWRGVGNNQINLSAIPDDVGKWKLGQTTLFGVGAASFNNLLWIAWTETDHHIGATTTADPSNKVSLHETSSRGVALAAFNGYLYLAWVGTDPIHPTLNIIRSPDGRRWVDKITLDETSKDRPALAAFNNQLYLAWRGRGEGHLNVIPFDGQSFGRKKTLDEVADAGPALASFNNLLYMAWPEGARLALASSNDGITWSVQTPFQESSHKSVALMVMGSSLIYCWTGTNSHLNLMSV